MNSVLNSFKVILLSKYFRFLFGLVILYFIFHFEIIDVNELTLFEINYYWLVFAFLMICSQIALAAFRWQSLLKGIQIDLNFWTLLKLTWIGQFYSTFAFGTVGSDISKTALVFKKFNEKKKRISLTIVIDRVQGLICLILIASASLIFAPDSFSSKIDDNAVALSGAALSLALLIALLVFKNRNELAQKLPLFSKFREEFIRRRFLKHLQFSFFLAFASQLGMSMIFFTIMLSLGGSMTLTTFLDLLWLAPVYLLSTLLPITPSGIGVGQAVLAYMFSISKVGSPAMGATVATLFQVLGILSNSFGVFAVLEKGAYSKQTLSKVGSGERN